MKNKRKIEIAVGLVSAVAIIILILGISFAKGIGTNSVTIKMIFPNSGGIQLTSPVLVNGVKRGSVTDVKNYNGAVEIKADIDNTDDIYTDAVARITILEITGGKKIEIFPGKSNIKMDINKHIQGTTPADLADLIAVGGDMIYDLQSVIKRVDSIAYAVNTILNDGQSIGKIQNIISNTEEITSNLNSFINKNSGDIQLVISNLKKLSTTLNNTVDKNEPKVSKIINEIDNTITELKKTLANGNNAINSLDSLAASFSEISKDIKNGKGVVSKLLYDSELATKLDSAVYSLSDFLNLIKQYGINVNVRLGTRP